jgi:hypothetical protein
MLKICKVCEVEKNISDFYTGRKDCKDCKNAAARQWRKDNPENVKRHLVRMRERTKERRYGITQEDFNKMLTDQNNKCKICKIIFISSKGTHIDHCHDTNIVRGLLCNDCNLALGQFNDNIEIMNNAIKYLS